MYQGLVRVCWRPSFPGDRPGAAVPVLPSRAIGLGGTDREIAWSAGRMGRRPRASFAAGEWLGRERQVHHQHLKVGSGAERVEGRLGPVKVGVAVA